MTVETLYNLWLVKDWRMSVQANFKTSDGIEWKWDHCMTTQGTFHNFRIYKIAAIHSSKISCKEITRTTASSGTHVSQSTKSRHNKHLVVKKPNWVWDFTKDRINDLILSKSRSKNDRDDKNRSENEKCTLESCYSQEKQVIMTMIREYGMGRDHFYVMEDGHKSRAKQLLSKASYEGSQEVTSCHWKRRIN